MLLTLKDRLFEAKQKLEQAFKKVPEILLILGSGLGDFADQLEDPVYVQYRDIPHFPTSTVKGHMGRLVAGYLDGRYVVAMQGRFHYYEGYKLHDVTFPIKVMSGMGTKVLVVTNAAGIINAEFKPSDLMLITDHINMMGTNPLIGPNDDEVGPRFPDMSNIYTNRLQKLAMETAREMGLLLHQGVYAAVSGPSYETPAEVRMLRTIGVDAVGMSTVPEAIVARYCGMEVLGLSCLSNYGAGMEREEMCHEEVLANAYKAKDVFAELLRKTLAKA